MYPSKTCYWNVFVNCDELVPHLHHTAGCELQQDGGVFPVDAFVEHGRVVGLADLRRKDGRLVGAAEELLGRAHEHVVVQQSERPKLASQKQHVLLVQVLLGDQQLPCTQQWGSLQACRGDV